MEWETSEEVLKSERDYKTYKIIQLPNGLRALLISKQFPSDDQEESEEEVSGEATVAMCVNVGTFQDPPNIQGLAHLTEHMLFNGTQMFPTENGLRLFLNSVGGSSNAYTENDRTVYHFTVDETYIFHALQMFSQFFISPLFKPDSLQSEIEAVDNEFSLKCTLEEMKQELLFNLMAKKHHPMSKFSWGNKNSLQGIPSQLKVDIQKEIRRFFSSYYTARNMALVVYSAYSVSDLQEMITILFSLVIDGPVPCRDFDPYSNPFVLDRFNSVYWVESINKNKSLILSWSFYPINIYYKTKPFQFLANIFERENKGSLICVLRRRHLATKISSCTSKHFYVSSHSIFNIRLNLTDYGFDNICETISVVLSFIEFLKLNNYNFDMFYRECKKLEYYNFNYDMHENIDVTLLSEAMFLFEPEHVIAGRVLFFDYDRDLLLDCIKQLTHQEMNIMVFSQTIDKKHLLMKEPRTGFSYSTNNISINWINKFKKVISDTSFQIPDPNIFFPLNFDIIFGEEDKEPITIAYNLQSRINYRKVDDIDLPKGSIYFRLISPIVTSDPQTIVALEMAICIISRYLREECSDALYAKFNFNINISDKGLIFTLDGFNDKIFILFTSILNQLVHFNIDDSFFDLIKLELERIHSQSFATSTVIANEVLETLMMNGRSTLIDKQFVLQFVTKDEVLTIFKEFLANLLLEGIIEGNITSKVAQESFFILKNKLLCSPLSSTMDTKVRVNKVPPKSFCCRVLSWNKEDYTSVIYNYYQIGTDCEYKGVVVAFVISQIKEKIFNELRMQEHLGYVVSCNYIIYDGVQGFSIVIESPSNKFSCDYIYQRIQAYIDRTTNRLMKMTTAEIATLLPEPMGSPRGAEPVGLLLTNYDIFHKLIEKLKNEEFPIISVQIVGKNDPVINQKRKFCTDINHKMFSQNVRDVLIKCPCCKLQNCVGKCVKMNMNPLLKIKHSQRKKDLIFIRSMDYFKKSLETYPVIQNEFEK